MERVVVQLKSKCTCCWRESHALQLDNAPIYLRIANLRLQQPMPQLQLLLLLLLLLDWSRSSVRFGISKTPTRLFDPHDGVDNRLFFCFD